MVPYKSPRPDGRFDVRHAHTQLKLARNVSKMTVFGYFWPLKPLWRPFFGLFWQQMVPYESPRPDGRFDVWHAHTW